MSESGRLSRDELLLVAGSMRELGKPSPERPLFVIVLQPGIPGVHAESDWAIAPDVPRGDARIAMAAILRDVAARLEADRVDVPTAQA